MKNRIKTINKFSLKKAQDLGNLAEKSKNFQFTPPPPRILRKLAFFLALLLTFSCGGEGESSSSSGSSSSSSSTATANLALSITVTPTRILSGSDITFNVKVQNNGDATSRAATLGFYRSSDAAISNSDTSLNSSAITVPSIAADASLDIARSFAGHHSGTMHYGACLIDASGENTCSNAILIEVIPVDLSIASLNVTPNRIYSGGSINFSGEIQNSGETASTFATLKIYRSNDAEISNSDTSLKSLSLASIAAGASINIAETIGGHSTGTMYYGVCVVDVSSETNTGNNCTTGIAVDIIPVSLFVASFNATPNRIFSGGALNISGHLQNNGAEVNNSATLGFYRSSDSNISTSDTSIDISIISVASDASFDISTRSITGHNTGTMYYGACVVTTNGETSCSTGVAITIIPPDLAIATLDINPKFIQATDTNPNIVIKGKVENRGSTAPKTILNFYRSSDETINHSDTLLATEDIAMLTPEASQDFNVNVERHNTDTYYYGVCLSDVSGEVETNNNCSIGVAVEVVNPDLEVASINAPPNRISLGSNITLSGKIQNSGRGEAPTANLKFYRSEDTTISNSDTLLTTIAISNVTTDASIDFSRSVASHNAGTYYYGVCLTDVIGEFVINNNCSSGFAVGITVDRDGNGLIEIDNLTQLYNIRYNTDATSYKTSRDATGRADGCPNNLCKGYELKANLDFDTNNNGTYTMSGGNYTLDSDDSNSAYFNTASGGWQPIPIFSGIFEGNDYTINNLSAIRSEKNLGLFEEIDSSGEIRNLKLTNALMKNNRTDGTFSNPTSIGILVGKSSGTIVAVSTSGRAVADSGEYISLGGLIGEQISGNIVASNSSASVKGIFGNNNYGGGLIGNQRGSILVSYATGNVNGGLHVGGFVGSIGNNGSIIASYATGNVLESTGSFVGGFTGSHYGNFTASYSIGNVDVGASGAVGRLIGFRISTAIINSYGFGDVTGETPNTHGSPPSDATTASDLTLAIAGVTWNQASSNTLGAWDFGDATQNPALKFADYDGSGNDFACRENPAGSTTDSTIYIPHCGDFLAGQGRTPVPNVPSVRLVSSSFTRTSLTTTSTRTSLTVENLNADSRGSRQSFGRVEILNPKTNEFGTVCSDNFDEREALVVCRQLGFQRGQVLNASQVEAGIGAILLDDLHCTGTESNLFECQHNGIKIHNCQHNEDAGVSCSY